MALTVLDPVTALIVVDLQAGIVSRPLAHSVGEILSRAGALAASFRRQGLPVVLVAVSGGAPGRNEQPRMTTPPAPGWMALASELYEQPSDILITKRTWGAFTKTKLDEELKARSVTQVVLAGIATSIGVESTARHAHELGYNVALAIDAMTDMNADAHANSVEQIFPRLGERATSAEIIALIDSRSL